MPHDPAIIAAMAAIERTLADTIVARALAHPDPATAKFHRSLWRLCKTRADYLEEMANG